MKYVLAVEGGGTKITSAITDKKGNLKSVGKGGPSSYNMIGEEGLKRSFKRSLEMSLRNLNIKDFKFEIAYLGISGITKSTSKRVKKRIEKVLTEKVDVSKIIFDNEGDLGVAFASSQVFISSPCSSYVTILAGTGAGAYGRNKNGEERVLHGWGNLVGDEGSGYDIGRQAVIAMVRSFDGRGSDTLLKTKLLNHPIFKTAKIARSKINKSVKDLTRDQMRAIWAEITKCIYGNSGLKRHEVASLYPVVIKAAREGDRIANEILKAAGVELGLLVLAMVHVLGMEKEAFQVSPVGGVFNAKDFFYDSFSQTVRKVAPQARIMIPILQPIIGAIYLALGELDITLNEQTKETIRAFVRKIKTIESDEL